MAKTTKREREERLAQAITDHPEATKDANDWLADDDTFARFLRELVKVALPYPGNPGPRRNPTAAEMRADLNLFFAAVRGEPLPDEATRDLYCARCLRDGNRVIRDSAPSTLGGQLPEPVALCNPCRWHLIRNGPDMTQPHDTPEPGATPQPAPAAPIVDVDVTDPYDLAATITRRTAAGWRLVNVHTQHVTVWTR
jgi:hypothetical protein